MATREQHGGHRQVLPAVPTEHPPHPEKGRADMMEVYWSEFAGRPQVSAKDARRLTKLQAKYGPAIAAYQAGVNLKQAAAKSKSTGASLGRAMARLGIERRPQGTRIPKETAKQRAADMLALYKTMTLQEIGDKYGVTRERVRQIITEADKDGAKATKLARFAQRHAEIIKRDTRLCVTCGKTFTAKDHKQKHCSRKCGCGTKPRIDEQKHRDALAARENGIGWARIGREIYGSACKHPQIVAYQAFTRWAKRTGYDASWLKYKQGSNR